MKAIEASAKIDAQGQLSLDAPLMKIKPGSVRVIILLAENEEYEDQHSVDDASSQISQYQERELMPEAEFQAGLKADLAAAGNNSRDEILQLVQAVKQEIVAEREAEFAVMQVEE